MKREGLLPLIPLLSACTGTSPRTPDAAPTRSFDELLLEGQTLGELISLRSLSLVALVAGAAFAANRLTDTALRIVWRLGFDSERRLARPAALFKLLLTGAALLVLARSALHVAPIFASVLALALVVGALFTSGFFADALAGIGLAFRRTPRVGDRVTIADHAGIVREIQLTKLQLRGTDGSTIVVPNRLLNQHTLDIDGARNTVPIQVGVEIQEPSQVCIRALRRSLVLSPYRAPGTPVDVTTDLVNSKLCTFEVQVWSTRATREAKAQLQATVERTLLAHSSTGEASADSRPRD